MADDQVKIKKESDSCSGMTRCSDDSYYPYGTSLSIDNDLVDDLGIGSLAVGDVVEIRGYAFVDSKSEYSNKEGSSKDVRLQMTSIKINRESDDRIAKLYGDENG